MLFITTIFLVFTVQRNYSNSTACFMKKVWHVVKIVADDRDFDEQLVKSLSIKESDLDISYWNSELGNDQTLPIKKGYEAELLQYWLADLPLKVIIHGWLDSTETDDGVFCIKTAYVDVGGFNVISVDWGTIAGNKVYMYPVMLTTKIGFELAHVLDNIVELGIVDPKDIHLIGHSLGAHVAGACGSSFKSGKIGRITGLDPAGPGFEFAKFHQQSLNKKDARFVDVIHTSGGSTGFFNSLGHADFYPNGGSPPQPGCYEGIKFKGLVNLVGCSHSRAYSLYADSVYNRKSMIAKRCSSWLNYKEHKCDKNVISPMGHDASPRARGNFYLRTTKAAPYAVPKLEREDL